MTKFNPLEPFASKRLLNEVLGEMRRFRYKLYGNIPPKFHRGKPTKYEFDLALGVIHFTEQDFKGLSAIFEKINNKWGTRMTFCLYPSKKLYRNIVINIRGSPKAPAEIG
jgi:hypothetical protein